MKTNDIVVHECDLCGNICLKNKHSIKKLKIGFCSINCQATFNGILKSLSSKFVNCEYCNKKMFRNKNQLERSKHYYCNTSCQMKAEYSKGIRDKYETTKIANETLRRRTQDRFDSGQIKKMFDKYGYVHIYVPKEGFVREHRYIMEQHLGRKLKDEEHIHHINHVKYDNRIENLKITTNSEHGKEHYKEREIDSLGRFK